MDRSVVVQPERPRSLQSRLTTPSSMTNATVAADAGANDELRQTLTYKGGRRAIVVPRGIPVMTTGVGSPSIPVPGADGIVR